MVFQMVGAEWCDKCRQVKQILKSRGLWELVDYIDYDAAEEGKILQEKLGAENLPFFIVDGRLVAHAGEFLHLLTETSLNQAFAEGESSI